MKKIILVTMIVIVLVAFVGCGMGESLTEKFENYKLQKMVDEKFDIIDEQVKELGLGSTVETVIAADLKGEVVSNPELSYLSKPIEHNGKTYRIVCNF